MSDGLTLRRPMLQGYYEGCSEYQCVVDVRRTSRREAVEVEEETGKRRLGCA